MKHEVLFKEVPPNCYAAAILLQRAYKQMERKAWSKARKEFLDEELKKHGNLTCFYCYRTNLKRKGGKQHEKATIDHIVARSEGGHETNKENFVVCCEGCNRKKANQTQEEFLSSKYLQNKRKSKA